MKTRFILLFSIVLLVSCNKEAPREDYLIKGTAEGLYNGIRVYLNSMNPQGRMVAIDTGIVVNEKFELKGNVSEPTLYFLTTQSVPGRVPMMIENSLMTLRIDNKILKNSVLEGSKSNDVLQEYGKRLGEYQTKMKTLRDAYSDAKFLSDSVALKEIQIEVEETNLKFVDFPYEFIEENKNSYVVFEVLEPQLRNKNIDFERITATYEGLSPELKQSYKGQTFKKSLEDLKLRVERARATDVGRKVPDFSAPTPDGEALTLSDVYKKGEVTIIDFWAAWCGPCRRENPNVVKVYNEYHDKGLEIIGVSLDGRRGQQNPKETWIKAIEDDQLTWHQVSNLQYFGPIANQFNVSAIPAMFVVDSDGVIIAKNLRGPALERKIAELLGD